MLRLALVLPLVLSFVFPSWLLVVILPVFLRVSSCGSRHRRHVELRAPRAGRRNLSFQSEPPSQSRVCTLARKIQTTSGLCSCRCPYPDRLLGQFLSCRRCRNRPYGS